MAAEVLTIFQEPVPKAALRVLDIAERQLKPKKPALAWDKVALVSEWIREIGS